MTIASLTRPDIPEDVPVPLEPARSAGDRVFRGILALSGVLVLATLLAIVLYLCTHSVQAVRHSGVNLIKSDHFALGGPFGLLGVLVGSVLIAVIALMVALPVSIATALLINEYAPRRLRLWMTSLVDLLAALPSLIYGLWGLVVLGPEVYGTSVWLSYHANFIPIFSVPDPTWGNSLFLCGIVAVMILPIVTSISREVMSQAPRDACEAALALGGTRWGMVTDVILPFAKGGILGGSLLGLGRALGETIAVLFILSPNNTIWIHILHPGGGAIAPLIAQDFTSASDLSKSALVFAGLLLFTTTLVVNLVARTIVGRAARRAA